MSNIHSHVDYCNASLYIFSYMHNYTIKHNYTYIYTYTGIGTFEFLRSVYVQHGVAGLYKGIDDI